MRTLVLSNNFRSCISELFAGSIDKTNHVGQMLLTAFLLNDSQSTTIYALVSPMASLSLLFENDNLALTTLYQRHPSRARVTILTLACTLQC